MRAAVLWGPGEVAIEDVADATVVEPSDAVVRVTHAAVSGSDLHVYRGTSLAPRGRRPGHEFVGVVDAVGADVTTVGVGDAVVAPLWVSCGRCGPCAAAEFTSCHDGGYFGSDRIPGAQAEAVRVPYADGTLWRLPDPVAEPAALPAVLLLAGAVGTGEHAIRCAGVAAADTVVVVGDGAVGLSAVLAARRRDPDLLIVVGHHPERLDVARAFGADEVVDGRDVHVVEEVVGLTGGRMADVVVECVGGGPAPFDLATALVRDFGRLASVGVPWGASVDLREMFERNLRVASGVAPTRAYLDDLVPLLAEGALDPTPMLTDRLGLDDVAEAYRRMDRREDIKVLLAP